MTGHARAAASTAENLRRCAALIRARALAATPSPWSRGDNEVCADADLIFSAEHPHGLLPQAGPMEIADCYREERPGERQANAEHIASWHPAVAIAVADLLEHAVDALPINPAERPRNPLDRALVLAALHVAKEYLGDQWEAPDD